jgi:uracil-DNA glycosylase family 4
MNAGDRWGALNEDVMTCRKCPRLVAWREQVAKKKRRMFRDEDYWGKPVPGFGDHEARLLIVGLAPAAHGANRTGRMFTGGGSAETLMTAMLRAGFSNRSISLERGDGLEFSDAYLTAVARCAPPKNRPTAQELANCRPYLQREFELLGDLKVVLALGKMAFDGYLRMLKEMGYDPPRLKFGHGAWHEMPESLPVLAACYHPSRQNTQTGRLTQEMIDAIFLKIQDYLQ